jgi:hypothetical protein
MKFQMPSSKLLQLAFGVRRFSWEDVEKAKSQVEDALNSRDKDSGDNENKAVARVTRTTDVCLPSSDMAALSSKTLTVEEVSNLFFSNFFFSSPVYVPSVSCTRWERKSVTAASRAKWIFSNVVMVTWAWIIFSVGLY